jgi:hypothetical protein
LSIILVIAEIRPLLRMPEQTGRSLACRNRIRFDGGEEMHFADATRISGKSFL